MNRELLKQALYALKYHSIQTRPIDLTNETIETLRQELAKPEQEPVAWMVRDQVDGCRYPSALKNPAGSINGESQPLYTAPPRKEWVGLTATETNHIFAANVGYPERMCRAIEAKLKEKNGAL